MTVSLAFFVSPDPSGLGNAKKKEKLFKNIIGNLPKENKKSFDFIKFLPFRFCAIHGQIATSFILSSMTLHHNIEHITIHHSKFCILNWILHSSLLPPILNVKEFILSSIHFEHSDSLALLLKIFKLVYRALTKFKFHPLTFYTK